jgi:hypothetical protein
MPRFKGAPISATYPNSALHPSSTQQPSAACSSVVTASTPRAGSGSSQPTARALLSSPLPPAAPIRGHAGHIADTTKRGPPLPVPGSGSGHRAGSPPQQSFRSGRYPLSHSDRFPESQISCELTGAASRRLAPLRAVDSIKPYPGLPMVVQDRDRVAIGDADHFAGERGGFGWGRCSGCAVLGQESQNGTQERETKAHDETGAEVTRHHAMRYSMTGATSIFGIISSFSSITSQLLGLIWRPT